ncbi:MAG: DUF4838 domain-containing protein [Clostridia bacterium]|nr:DUF4838 domain-containing protein [Clostridia bacterium]
MKKFLSILLLTAILASTLCFAIPSGARTYGYRLGDVNDDGRISIKDVVLLKMYLAGISSVKDVCVKSADVNKSGSVELSDISQLKGTISGDIDAELNNDNGKYKVTELKIAGRNISRYTIVIPAETRTFSHYYAKLKDGLSEPIDYNNANNYTYQDVTVTLNSMGYSADVLQAKINKACGITLNIADSDDTVNTYKIIYKYDTAGTMGLGKEGFDFSFDSDGNFVITCGTLRGCLYATYEFLEKFCGYTFLTGNYYDAGHEYLATLASSNVPADFHDRQTPGFEYRAVAGAATTSKTSGDRSKDNFLALRINASEDSAYAAYKGDYVADYGGAEGTSYVHAHSFAYYDAGWGNTAGIDSIGGNTQPCMTNSTFIRKCYDYMCAIVNRRDQIPGYQYTQITCSPNDNGNFCVCNNCKTVYRAEGSMSGALIRLCNAVAGGDPSMPFFTYYPELKIYTCAYAGLQKPCVTAPRSNVVVCFCPVGCNCHLLSNTTESGNPRLAMSTNTGVSAGIGEKNSYYMDWLDGWLALTPNVYFWYYSVNFVYYISPAPNLYNFYEDTKFLYNKGVKGLYFEGNKDSIDNTFECLKAYLQSKIMWNPNMSAAEYVGYMDKYLELQYGPGWTYIKDYIVLVENTLKSSGCWTDNFDGPWGMYNKSAFASNFETVVNLFDSAYAAAENNRQRERVDMTRVHAYFLGLSATYGSGSSNYNSRYSWLWNYINDRPSFRIKTSFSGDPAHGSNFPASASDVRDTMTWLGSNYTGVWTGAMYQPIVNSWS